MLSKFKDGLAFGAGFSIAYFVIMWGLGMLFSPLMTTIWSEEVTLESDAAVSTRSPDSTELTVAASRNSSSDDAKPEWSFFDMPLEEQIKAANFIAIATFEKQPDGRRAAILTEIFKQEGNMRYPRQVGDEWHEASYMPGVSRHEWNHDAVLIMRTAKHEGRTLGVDKGRIGSLGEITVENLRTMCEAAEEREKQN